MADLMLPTHPFTPSQARQLGVPRAVLDEAVADGRLHRPLRGVFLRAGVEPTMLVRAQAAKLVTGPTLVVCDRSAAWLWGVDCYRYAELDGTPRLETCALRGHQASERHGIDGVTRDLLREDWTEFEGLRVTTPLRTAMDLGCLLPPHVALGAMDELMRRHGFTNGDLRALLRRYRGRRGVVRLRQVVALVDPRAESQPESWVRWFIVAEGMPHPLPQVWVEVDGRAVRLDLAYPRARILVEYDGEEFHSSWADREHDERRREALRRAGWIVIVVTRDGLTAAGRDAWLRELADALAARGVRF